MICSFGGRFAFAASEGTSQAEEDLIQEILKSIDEIVTEDAEAYYSALGGNGELLSGGGLKEFLTALTMGEGYDIGNVFELLWTAIKTGFADLLAGFVTIIGLAFLYGISKNVSGGLMGETTDKIIYYVVYSAILTAYVAMLANVITSASQTVGKIAELSEIAFPIMVTLMTALGGGNSAMLCNQGAYIFGNTIISVINVAIFPLFYAALVLCIIGNLSDSVKLGKLTSALTSIAKWVMGILFGAFSAITSAVGLAGAGLDGVSIRSAKFALSGYVPILGGYLSDGFDVVMGSAVVIKNAFGLGAVIMLLAVMLVPVVKCVIFMLATKLVGGVTEPVAGGRISNMFTSASKCLEILISIILGTAFCVFVLLLIGITTCNGGII